MKTSPFLLCGKGLPGESPFLSVHLLRTLVCGCCYAILTPLTNSPLAASSTTGSLTGPAVQPVGQELSGGPSVVLEVAPLYPVRLKPVIWCLSRATDESTPWVVVVRSRSWVCSTH